VIPLRLVVYRNAHFLAPGKSVETVEKPQQSSRVGFVYQYEGGSLEDVQLLLGQVRAGANRNRIACGLHAQAPHLWQSRAVERQLKSFSTITSRAVRPRRMEITAVKELYATGFARRVHRLSHFTESDSL